MKHLEAKIALLVIIIAFIAIANLLLLLISKI
jgi:hypothetical protein